MLGNFSEGRGWAVLVVVGLLVPFSAGCIEGAEGTAAFYVKDQPEDDWAHVNVTFTEIRVHQAQTGEDEGNETDDNESDEADGDGGEWITIEANESGREVDLLAFSSEDARALLGASELETGLYNQVLINMTEAYGIDADSGERVDFQLTRPELRLTRAWEVMADNTTHIVADIDLDRSIVQQGNGEVRFNPVIGQVLIETDETEPSDAPDGGDGNQTDQGQGPGEGPDSPHR